MNYDFCTQFRYPVQKSLSPDDIYYNRSFLSTGSHLEAIVSNYKCTPPDQLPCSAPYRLPLPYPFLFCMLHFYLLWNFPPLYGSCPAKDSFVAFGNFPAKDF